MSVAVKGRGDEAYFQLAVGFNERKFPWFEDVSAKLEEVTREVW